MADAGSTTPLDSRLQVAASGSAPGCRYTRAAPLSALTVPRNAARTEPTLRVSPGHAAGQGKGVRGQIAIQEPDQLAVDDPGGRRAPVGEGCQAFQPLLGREPPVDPAAGRDSSRAARPPEAPRPATAGGAKSQRLRRVLSLQYPVSWASGPRTSAAEIEQRGRRGTGQGVAQAVEQRLTCRRSRDGPRRPSQDPTGGPIGRPARLDGASPRA